LVSAAQSFPYFSAADTAYFFVAGVFASFSPWILDMEGVWSSGRVGAVVGVIMLVIAFVFLVFVNGFGCGEVG
jgi:predicted alpha/beta hydrolase